MKRSRRQLDKGAIELIEEAFHLLRRAPLPVLASYYAGGVPFVLGWLYFWTDMGRSPFAYQRLAGEALGVAVLFLWMKFCQTQFVLRIRDFMTGDPPSAPGYRWSRIFVSQAALQTSGLFLLPLALLLTLPFPWVYAFYQNVTALDDGDANDVRSLLKEALQQAGFWPKQNHLLLAILFGFGVFVFLNCSLMCLALPWLAKTLFGVESVLTRNEFSLLNTTFFAVMFGLTYLCVDPLCKVTYALRCFYGQSRQSGVDLKAELRQMNAVIAQIAAYLILAVILVHPGSVNAAESPHSSKSISDFSPQTANASIPPPELDQTISEVLKQQKYTWRAPREQLQQADEKKGLLGRFLDRVREWLRSVRDWIIKWLRKLFGQRQRGGTGSESGYGWIFALEILLSALVAVVIAALAILLYRVFRRRTQKPTVVATEPIQPVPDLSDEDLGAEQLPEDGWTRLGRELLERGELRLALRAFYLATLAYLASRQLVSLAKFKSNRDYQQELTRRGHSFPRLLSMFGDNVQVFDRVRYGRHDVNAELVQQFQARVEQIRAQEL